MDPKELEKLCAKLSLFESESKILQVGQGVVESGRLRMERCLLGKVLGSEPVNKEGLEDVTRLMWRTANLERVEQRHGFNVFLFQFHSSEDCQRIYNGGPWTFNKKLLVLIKPAGLGENTNMDFSKSSFWIQFHNVPIALENETLVRDWAKEVGEVEEVEIRDGYVRARVKLDVTKPLKRGIRISIGEAQSEITLLILYECLPEFCYYCGVIGHKMVECGLSGMFKNAIDKDDRPFGEWLKAAPPSNRGKQQVLGDMEERYTRRIENQRLGVDREMERNRRCIQHKGDHEKGSIDISENAQMHTHVIIDNQTEKSWKSDETHLEPVVDSMNWAKSKGEDKVIENQICMGARMQKRSPTIVRQTSTEETSLSNIRESDGLFVKVDSLKPATNGHTLIVKVLSKKPQNTMSFRGPQNQNTRIAECLVGDETGTIFFTARNNQVDLMEPGNTLILRNAKVNTFKGQMRLAVDKWGRIGITEPTKFVVKEDNNLSLIEYELVNVDEEP